jgi:hypothetical protein
MADEKLLKPGDEGYVALAEKTKPADLAATKPADKPAEVPAAKPKKVKPVVSESAKIKTRRQFL